MDKTIIRELIQDISVFSSDLEALLLITKDTISLRDKKVVGLNTKFKKSLESFMGVEQLKKVFEGNKKSLKTLDVYANKFDYLFYNSIFINAFSLFELYLSNIADVTEKLSTSKVKVSDIKGNGIIDTVRKYLELVIQIPSANSSNPIWGEILEFKSIRNAIVHNENKLNLNNTKNFKSIKGYSKILEHDIEHSGQEIYFKINNIKFLEAFKTTTETYSTTIVKEIIKNYS